MNPPNTDYAYGTQNIVPQVLYNQNPNALTGVQQHPQQSVLNPHQQLIPKQYMVPPTQAHHTFVGQQKRIVNQHDKIQQHQQQQQKAKDNKNLQQEKYYKDKVADFGYLLQSGYKVYKELGRGGYGVVYKASDARENGASKKKFAIKINFQTVSPELIFSEIAFLTLLKGQPNTPQMCDLFTYEEKTHIVIEYFKYQPFIEFFADANMDDIKHYIYQMLLGVRTLRSLGIFHRDVKPGNFLYNKDIKKGILIDYGLSEIDDRHIDKLKEEQKQKKDPELQKKIDLYMNIKKCEKIVGKNKIGTESFMPLESILRYRDQGYQVDIWPIGVVFLQFLLKKYNIFNNVRMQNKPNQKQNNHNKSGQLKNTYFITFILELANIFGSDAVVDLCKKYEYEVTIPKELPKGPINFKEIIQKEGFDDVAEDLLKKLIALDQSERISVEDALAHRFFDSIRESEERDKQAQKQGHSTFNQQMKPNPLPQQSQIPLSQTSGAPGIQNHMQITSQSRVQPQQMESIMNPFPIYSYPQIATMNAQMMPLYCVDINGATQNGFVLNQPQQNFQNYNPKNMMNLQQK